MCNIRFSSYLRLFVNTSTTQREGERTHSVLVWMILRRNKRSNSKHYAPFGALLSCSTHEEYPLMLSINFWFLIPGKMAHFIRCANISRTDTSHNGRWWHLLCSVYCISMFYTQLRRFVRPSLTHIVLLLISDAYTPFGWLANAWWKVCDIYGTCKCTLYIIWQTTHDVWHMCCRAILAFSYSRLCDSRFRYFCRLIDVSTSK